MHGSAADGVVRRVRVAGAVVLRALAVVGPGVAALIEGEARVLPADGAHWAPGLAYPQRRLSPAFRWVDLLHGGRVVLPPHGGVEALPFDGVASRFEGGVSLRQRKHRSPGRASRVALELPGQELLLDVQEQLWWQRKQVRALGRRGSCHLKRDGGTMRWVAHNCVSVCVVGSWAVAGSGVALVRHSRRHYRNVGMAGPSRSVGEVALALKQSQIEALQMELALAKSREEVDLVGVSSDDTKSLKRPAAAAAAACEEEEVEQEDLWRKKSDIDMDVVRQACPGAARFFFTDVQAWKDSGSQAKGFATWWKKTLAGKAEKYGAAEAKALHWVAEHWHGSTGQPNPADVEEAIALSGGTKRSAPVRGRRCRCRCG